jgi:hypothetical protein
MALYEYKCKNEKCEEFEKPHIIEIAMKEYSIDKIPNCEKCGEKCVRIFSLSGHQTFFQGYNGN